MLRLSLVSALFLTGCSPNSQRARPQSLQDESQLASGVIYGQDSRQEAVQSSAPMVRALSALSVALVNVTDLRVTGDRSVELLGKTYQEDQRLCSGERFAEQRTTAFCSGILVGRKYVLTAGHCMTSVKECEQTAFVIGLQLPASMNWNYTVDRSQIFNCHHIIAQRSLLKHVNIKTGFKSHGQNLPDDKIGLDFALIELDRPVYERVNLKISDGTDLRKGTPMFVLGYPSGLPKKIAQGVLVTSQSNSLYFRTNLDTYGGNSGSPVFNSATGALTGILIEGEEDFETTSQGCRVSRQCPENTAGCEGERVLKIGNLRRYLNF